MGHPPINGYLSTYKSRDKKVTIFCNICGKLPNETRTKRLVRDHNHQNGIIRGILCDDCNGFLGILESRKHLAEFIINARNSKEYKRWFKMFKDRIYYHLKCNTGIKYNRKIYIPFELLLN